ncbi:N-acetylmuramic acid 6-phosphate etherase [Francisella philomiragia]|uniref:N-acetylmuramic acid 6-phosphate etherase n=1 Tax=Francisella philomiragia subsp. philomiragia (strain ATCC 25017 / CCUG 19701 / FSC 153 / O\|nr:N-acetylmuramic acid 6-phosphate etherase [Francisella philomiragia]B0TXA4.1 RecName: Full=N-acetylmuramic acid 6-phosphate etherase; Short=MurNAc-6-P etherase; AltName: Full=N-acetylmuramic acid 6-phosphate hydrolase; AltName: Full=N-acetylmuramic acid 6-phosphate lyase [Francisella philomiragia subsp. philomiragia ATCC 25017]AJI47328.1 N-acetylmuramic acid 6-phosphate etherase [Francisella philomiragia]AJI48809.1 N-acetylmuramic acid 6-phosphate etherase [Francisella philomiragia]MBK202095
MSMLKNINTEKRNPRSFNLDSMSVQESVNLMIDEEYGVIEALKEQSLNIAKIVEVTSQALKKGGRIVYVGAGTSGRLGILDAVECPPTFSVDYNTIIGLIAGGEKAFIQAQEGAEDNPDFGKEDLLKINLTAKDVVIGIAASGRTPYVIGALEYANSIEATTIAISCTKQAKISSYADYNIEAVPGPEVLTGSTRLKAGTTQKLILNIISTLSMVSVGKVYQNLMVDVKPTNEKLVERSKNIICEATGVDYVTAQDFYMKANKSVKVAIVMILNDCDYEQALAILKKNNNFIKS